MCYDRRDYGRKDEARRLREDEERTRGRRPEEGAARPRRAGERERKPLTEKAREVVGSVR